MQERVMFCFFCCAILQSSLLFLTFSMRLVSFRYQEEVHRTTARRVRFFPFDSRFYRFSQSISLSFACRFDEVNGTLFDEKEKTMGVLPKYEKYLKSPQAHQSRYLIWAGWKIVYNCFFELSNELFIPPCESMISTAITIASFYTLQLLLIKTHRKQTCKAQQHTHTAAEERRKERRSEKRVRKVNDRPSQAK